MRGDGAGFRSAMETYRVWERSPRSPFPRSRPSYRLRPAPHPALRATLSPQAGRGIKKAGLFAGFLFLLRCAFFFEVLFRLLLFRLFLVHALAHGALLGCWWTTTQMYSDWRRLCMGREAGPVDYADAP